MKIGYVACSAFSGSTLLSFLVNLHPEVVSAGHSTGWVGLTPEFACSCGDRVEACPFFSHVGGAFAEQGLSFPLQGFFPNAYRVSRVERLNQLLFGKFPGLSATALERARDRVLRRLPRIASRLRRIERSNVLFFEAACRYAGASVYVDNSHSPHRFRQLTYIPSLEVTPVHLVRDPRGVVLSDMEIYGWGLEFAARHWIRAQENIARVLIDAHRPAADDYARQLIAYEDLCDAPLAAVNRFLARLGVEPLSALGDFKQAEHHILGNRMRFGDGTITKSERWRSKLTATQQERILQVAHTHCARSRLRPQLEAVLGALPC